MVKENPRIDRIADSHFEASRWRVMFGITSDLAVAEINSLARKLKASSLSQWFRRLFFWSTVLVFTGLVFALLVIVYGFKTSPSPWFLVGLPVFGIIVYGALFEWSKHAAQPDLTSMVPNPCDPQTERILEYWATFLKSDSPAYKNLGVQGYGRPLPVDMFRRSFAILALISHKSNRWLIDSPGMDFTGEWWFPKPETLTSPKAHRTLLSTVIKHQDQQAAIELLGLLQAHVEVSALPYEAVKKQNLEAAKCAVLFRDDSKKTRKQKAAAHLAGEDMATDNTSIEKILNHASSLQLEKIIKDYLDAKKRIPEPLVDALDEVFRLFPENPPR